MPSRTPSVSSLSCHFCRYQQPDPCHHMFACPCHEKHVGILPTPHSPLCLRGCVSYRRGYSKQLRPALASGERASWVTTPARLPPALLCPTLWSYPPFMGLVLPTGYGCKALNRGSGGGQALNGSRPDLPGALEVCDSPCPLWHLWVCSPSPSRARQVTLCSVAWGHPKACTAALPPAPRRDPTPSPARHLP